MFEKLVVRRLACMQILLFLYVALFCDIEILIWVFHNKKMNNNYWFSPNNNIYLFLKWYLKAINLQLRILGMIENTQSTHCDRYFREFLVLKYVDFRFVCVCKWHISIYIFLDIMSPEDLTLLIINKETICIIYIYI